MNEKLIKDGIPSQDLMVDDSKYLDGRHNKLIRYYYYLERGLDILNIFRNLGLGIFAAYFALKLDNYLLLLAMGVVSAVILTIVGYYNVHTLSKMKEWLGMRFSTHYGIRSFNFSQGQYELLVEIRDLLKRRNETDFIEPKKKEISQEELNRILDGKL